MVKHDGLSENDHISMMKIILAEEYISFEGIHYVHHLCQQSMFSQLFIGLVRSESAQKTIFWFISKADFCKFIQFYALK